MTVGRVEPAVYIQPKPMLPDRPPDPSVSPHRDEILRRLPPEAWPIVFMAMVARNGRFVFVRNPKAGCTTVAHRAYVWLTGKACEGDIHWNWDALAHGYEYLGEVVGGLTSGVPVFSFVRHPERRACSSFTNLLEGERNRAIDPHLPFLERMGYSPGGNRTRNFDVFLEYVELSLATDRYWTDPHFRPQTLNLRADVLRYSFIGRVERMDRDLRDLEAMLGVSVPSALEAVTRHNRSETAYVPTPAQLLRIRDLYAMDFEAFEY